MNGAREGAVSMDELVKLLVDYGYFNLAYREIPADFPAIKALPRNTPNTKEVEAIVAKHLPETADTSRPRQSWIRRWFTNPEPQFEQFVLRPDFHPDFDVAPENITDSTQRQHRFDPEEFAADGSLEGPTLLTQFRDEALKRTVSAHEQGLIDGLELAVQHLEAHMQSVGAAAGFESAIHQEVGEEHITVLRSLVTKAREMVAE